MTNDDTTEQSNDAKLGLRRNADGKVIVDETGGCGYLNRNIDAIDSERQLREGDAFEPHPSVVAVLADNARCAYAEYGRFEDHFERHGRLCSRTDERLKLSADRLQAMANLATCLSAYEAASRAGTTSGIRYEDLTFNETD